MSKVKGAIAGLFGAAVVGTMIYANVTHPTDPNARLPDIEDCPVIQNARINIASMTRMNAPSVEIRGMNNTVDSANREISRLVGRAKEDACNHSILTVQ